MKKSPPQTWLLLALAAVFTVALSFASLELPYVTDGLLQRIVASPGFDSHADETSLFKAELYIRHYHLRTIGYVNSDLDFTEQHLVINGASDLMVEIFGDAGRHARFAVAVASLPANVAVEIDAVFEIG